jgi:hypothetical protein
MLHDVVKVFHVKDYRLVITFDDGTSGEVDLREHITFDGVFSPLQSIEVFQNVKVNPDLGTICWENGADIDPVVLFSWVSGKPLSELIPLTSSNVSKGEAHE